MHFSIPDTVQEHEGTGSSYWSFHIHVNGVFHCKLRYSQLDKFHDQLRSQFPERTPSKIFPGKKLFAISGGALEERREALESFIQHVSQDPVISCSELFNDFLLNAQRDGWEEPHDVELNIYLMNGKKVVLPISSNDQTDEVFSKLCDKIQLDKRFFHYFALFLIQQQDNNNIKIVRRLQEFESPYLSLRAVPEDKPHKIVVRKNYCGCQYDAAVIEDRVAMNLLYVQIADDLARGWMICTNDAVKRQLSELQNGATSDRVEFLRVAKGCKFYGYMHFAQCTGDYPHEGSTVLVACGERELNTRVKNSDGNVVEGCFRVQRIRSWRLTSVPQPKGDDDNDDGDGGGGGGRNKELLYFAFEYLFAKDDLRWITLQSDQAIMMSMTLQGMVDEIIREAQGKGMPEYNPRSSNGDNHQPSNGEKTKNGTSTNGTTKNGGVGKAPFSHNTHSGAFSWRNNKKDENDEIKDFGAQHIGDDEL